MTYIQLTTVCQMACAHCCVDYGDGKKGQHMDLDTLKGAVNFSADYGDYVSLGGGEVTLHPKFREAVSYVLDVADLPLHIVTNGGKAIKGVSKNVRWLIELMESDMYSIDKLFVELSLDQFHDPVEDGYVLRWFKRQRAAGSTPRNYIRDVGDRLLARVGRALNLPADHYEWQEAIPESQCVCLTYQVYPDGRITACGCPDSPVIGNIRHHGYEITNEPNDLDQSEDGCFSPSKLAMLPASAFRGHDE